MGQFLLCFKSCLVALTIVRFTNGYNLDTKFPILYSSNQNESYFGYTVVLHSSGHEDKNSWLHVGAPRGRLGRKGQSTGTVFQCLVGKPCEQLQLPSSKRVQDGDWMGGAMDIQQVGTNQQYVVCGHHWYDSTNINTNAYFLPGACYWGNNNKFGFEAGKWLTLIRHTDRTTVEVMSKVKVYDRHLGQAGISVHMPIKDPNYVIASSGSWISESNVDILIGAPGIYNWAGNVISCKKPRTASELGYTCITPNNMNISSMFDYTGYQVTSGSFFKRGQLVYVASAPRAVQGKGRVLLLDLRNNNGKSEWQLITSVEGTSIGEYFGASLAVGDFNGDRLDDLIVGSPLSFTEHDEGCINLFYGNNNAKSLKILPNLRRICGASPGARFGTALMALGDLDRDGFGDLAVGAPYEDDNRGAVYIYNGGRDGLNAAYSQRIGAEKVNVGLRGFGISIARPLDIDDNKFNDLAVGSYISGNVAIFRSHPVVQLFTKLSSNVVSIDQTTTSFKITACVEYYGVDMPQEIAVTRTIRLVDEYRRVYFTNDNSLIETKNITVVEGKYCDDLDVTLTASKSNVLGVIEVRANASLVGNGIPGEVIEINESGNNYESTGFCKTCPVATGNKSSPIEVMKLEFALDCGIDKICNSKLILEARFKELSSNQYVIGATSRIDLLVDVSNEGEIAYGLQLNINIPAPIQVAQLPTNCDIKTSKSVNETDTVVICDVDEPLAPNKRYSLTMSLGMTAVTSDTEELNFLVSANTTSVDKNKDSNSQNLKLKLRYEADVKIVGNTVKNVYFHSKLINTIEFTHDYAIEKLGMSPIELVTIEIKIPTALVASSDGVINFLEIYKPSSIQDNQPLNCESTIGQYLENTVVIEESDTVDREKRSLVENNNNKQQVARMSLPANRTFFVNCSTENIKCDTIKCISRPFRSDTSSRFATVSITMRLRASRLEKYLGTRDIIHLETQGSVRIEKPRNIEHTDKTLHLSSIEATFFSEVAKQVVSNWLIAVSVGGGLLLLIFVILGLIKAGFFKRKKKEELEALIIEERVQADVRRSMMEAMPE